MNNGPLAGPADANNAVLRIADEELRVIRGPCQSSRKAADLADQFARPGERNAIDLPGFAPGPEEPSAIEGKTFRVVKLTGKNLETFDRDFRRNLRNQCVSP